MAAPPGASAGPAGPPAGRSARPATASGQTRRAASPAPSYAGSAAPAPALQLAKGDQVRHRAFGLGMVLSAQKVGGDVLLEIAFDQVGTKRLMLKSAASHMEKV